MANPCKAELSFGDGAALRCQLKKGHVGKHAEFYRDGRWYTEGARNVRVTWDGDDRELKTPSGPGKPVERNPRCLGTTETKEL